MHEGTQPPRPISFHLHSLLRRGSSALGFHFHLKATTEGATWLSLGEGLSESSCVELVGRDTWAGVTPWEQLTQLLPAKQFSTRPLHFFSPKQQFEGCKPKNVTLPWPVPSPILLPPEQKQATGHLLPSFWWLQVYANAWLSTLFAT